MLARALASVYGQELAPTEVIVVDDGSVLPLDPPRPTGRTELRVLRHDVPLGAAGARNAGTMVASGAYVAYLDSDDTWWSGKLKRQAALLEALPPGQRACATGFRLIRANRVELWLPDDIATRRQVLWGCACSPGSTLIIDRELLFRIGLFDEGFRRLEDWDWLLRAVVTTRITILREPLADIHVSRHPETTAVAASCRRLLDKHLRTLSFRERMVIRSSTRAEISAAHYHEGQAIEAVTNGLLAIMYWPFRNRQFYARAALRLLDLTLGRGPKPAA